MSFDSRKWLLGPHRRARSHEFLKGQGELPPNIPEDEAPSSPSTPRRSPDSTPASTPPKKSWERHYRSFLTTRSNSQSPEGTPPLYTDPSAGTRQNEGSRRSSKFSLVPGSKRLLIRQTSDERTSRHTSLPSIPKITSMPDLPKTRPSSDMTVKGGSFFSQVFQKDVNKNPGSGARRTKSMDVLDSSMRRGHEKTYSPKSLRSTKGLEAGLGPPNAPLLPSSILTKVLGPPSPLPLHPNSPRSQKPAALPTALSGSAKKPASTEIKKAFTEFHNSATFAKDSTSAYLGEDTSASGNTYFATYNKIATEYKDSLGHPERVCPRPSSSRNLSKSLDPVTEESFMHKSQRMLKSVAGPESWVQGRRYLLAPAILATCPIQVLPTLSGSKKIQTFDESVFGVLELGAATMTYVGKRKDAGGWSKCTLVLRQNYLLEYERDVAGIPRGFAHMENARAYPHQDFHNALELEFFGSPCAKSDKRKLLIRVEKTSDRDRWVSCLNDAAQLTIKDLYDFDEGNRIGTGRYASVYKARRRDTGQGPPNCAIKVVDKTEFWSRVVKGTERADTVVREASIQANLTAKGGKLPTVLKIYSLFETSDTIVLELELLEGIDLFRHVSSKSVLDETEAANIVRDILVCLEAMCRFGVAHRDIKPANILMCNKEKDGVYIKVADFGMSTFIGVDGLLRGRCGTPGYVAPEIFSAGINGGYGNKVDMFSTGVTLYVMLCGYEPFYGENDAELINANREAVLDFPATDWSNVSPQARGLVLAMLEADPSKRISAKDALQHPWISRRTERVPNPIDPLAKDFSVGAACTIS